MLTIFWALRAVCIFLNMKAEPGSNPLYQLDIHYAKLNHYINSLYTVNQQMQKDCVKRENYQRIIHQKFCFVFSFQFFLTNVMHIINATEFPLFCLNFARTCLILPAECSFQKSPFLLEILPAEFFSSLIRSQNRCLNLMPKATHLAWE